MKIFLVFLFILICESLRAQAPVIDYLQVDEAKSQLWVVGKFGIDSGSVTIEDTTLGLVSWSDTMIICGLPDSGKGAGGAVRVQTIGGTSAQRLLSVFVLHIVKGQFSYSNHFGWSRVWSIILNCNWRGDINRGDRFDSTFTFESSKSSSGYIGNTSILLGTFAWGDTTNNLNHTFSLQGSINFNQSSITGSIARLHGNYGYSTDSNIRLRTLTFDSSGILFGYRDTGEEFSLKKWDDSASGKILFPPFTKSTISQLSNGSNPDLIKISHDFTSENQTISVEAIKPLGEVTTSLFTIDGRLLRKTLTNISEPGFYDFDISGIDHQIGFLLFENKNWSLVKKIVF
jgi:hypothetical protein